MTQDTLIIWLQAVGGFLAVFLLNLAVKSLKDLSQSVSELNHNVAKLLERTDNHEKSLTDFGRRITRLEIGRGNSFD